MTRYTPELTRELATEMQKRDWRRVFYVKNFFKVDFSTASTFESTNLRGFFVNNGLGGLRVRNRLGKYIEDNHPRDNEQQTYDCRNVQGLSQEYPCYQCD